MELELRFSKSDRSSNWGFRMVGGADFQQPLIIVKVDEESLSEKIGLKEGDVIRKINDTDTATLTHSEAHDLITLAGLHFTLTVERGASIPPNILQIEDRNIEVRDVQVFVNEEVIEKAEDLAEILGKEIFVDFGQHKALLSKKSEKKMVHSNSTQTYIPTEDKVKQKKWSTFLQKPNRAERKPKKTEEEVRNEAEPYKIVIKKQSRRKPQPKEKRVQFDQNIVEVDIESLSSRNPDSPELLVSPEPYNVDCEQEPDSLDDNSYQQDDDNQYQTEDIEGYGGNDNETNFDNQLTEDPLDIKIKSINEIIIDDPNTESTLTLAEQLRSLQKQLEMLSQLPSEVQTTLDSVSKQLASIVSNPEETEDDNQDEAKEENREDVSNSSRAQAEGIEEGDDSIIGDDLEDDSMVDEELQAVLDRAKLEDDEEEERETKEIMENINAIEEEELKRKQEEEEELLAKKEKDMEGPPKPNFRPIVLPGGRKWIDPDDVVPKRRAKLTDEKIMELLEDKMEVIAGKRKGINFMKNTPPPKSLDHLQRSEVYRLIHGMEPSTRGITSRPEKILPEQDYYEASKQNSY
ncbi:unnamed protein product [Phyllotreta striolata]|uniref:PDZ domain-containing protein n=1 Tax=Phyllotreta striolata TaxID=444603 RepID=A0A9N9XMA1_PHYSR|nr:unnamed protein product [Phyllotreta striolata]